jgi:hypothetical protein
MNITVQTKKRMSSRMIHMIVMRILKMKFYLHLRKECKKELQKRGREGIREGLKKNPIDTDSFSSDLECKHQNMYS